MDELTKKSGRGGYRNGAGRPKGEETKRVRVPVGCLNDVLNLINSYRNEGQESKNHTVTVNQSQPPVRNKGQESKADTEPPTLPTKKGDNLPVKYWWTDASGSNVYWHGIGRQPKWIKDYLTAGGHKKDLDISSWKAGTKWKAPV